MANKNIYKYLHNFTITQIYVIIKCVFGEKNCDKMLIFIENFVFIFLYNYMYIRHIDYDEQISYINVKLYN